MNPIYIIGSITSMLGLGSSLVSQGVNIHRQMHQPQAYVQQQQQECLLPDKKLGKLVVVIGANGQRQLACVQQQGK